MLLRPHQSPFATQTETVVGLLADAVSDHAVRQIYRLKQRTGDKPLQILVPHLQAAEKLGIFSEKERNIAKTCWPGPLTLIVKRKPDANISRFALPRSEKTIGIRIPDAPHLLNWLKTYNRPIVATSANLSGRPALQLHQIKSVFRGTLAILPCTRRDFRISNRASTVASINEHDEITIHRQGKITKEMLEKAAKG
jgi:L-threonylcarbamoyladenylate synthase